MQRRITILLQRPDVRRSPVTAIWRRIIWKSRWWVTTRPCRVTLAHGLKMALPNGGAAALIYYQGVSEPETADFVVNFLKPGMVFCDIGAHAGEYTLVGAQAVGPSGEVHAFEANPAIYELLRDNIQLNGLRCVNLNPCAVSDQEGELEFEIYAEPSVCALRAPNHRPLTAQRRTAVKLLRVPSLRLDRYLPSINRKIDLVKIDVEGAELLVFRGAPELLALPKHRSATFVFECDPKNYARFGYAAGELFALLRGYGYGIWRYHAAAGLAPFDTETVPDGTVNLVAAKDEEWLRHTLRTRDP